MTTTAATSSVSSTAEVFTNTTTAPLSVSGIRAAIAPILAELAATARAREGTRDYPFEAVRALVRRGAVLVGVPVADGGAGGTLRDVTEVVIDIARADSNVAQALRATFLTAYRVRALPATRQRALALERLRRGEIFAGTGHERNGGANGAISTTLRRADDGYVVNGTKYYSTGGLYADWFQGSAKDETGRVVRFTVPTGRAGLELIDDFDAIGQRLSASGSTRFHDVRVSEDELLWVDEAPPGNPWPGSAAQLYLASIEAGIAAAVLDDAIWFGREKARPSKHSSAQRSTEDPYVRHVVGEIGARVHIARSSVLIAAETLAQVPFGRIAATEAREQAAHAAVIVAQAQYAAVESALRAAELLFDVGGGSATDRAYAFDRHWRNARTIANHNPRDWKAAVAGSYHLTGEDPPTSGHF
jgi:alkylation response protein AidB-like acyl-CoA dehydrogenase